jgi:hypothetical protein
MEVLVKMGHRVAGKVDTGRELDGSSVCCRKYLRGKRTWAGIWRAEVWVGMVTECCYGIGGLGEYVFTLDREQPG